MEKIVFFLVYLWSVSVALAQFTVQVGIIGDSSLHTVEWTTRVDHNYFIDLSTDLTTWVDSNIFVPGTGSMESHTFAPSPVGEELFYRIVECKDVTASSFLTLPTEAQEIDILDGVCFAFDLDFLCHLNPVELLIEKRVNGSGNPFERIGRITDIETLDGIITVRGSVVWLPDTPDEYDVKVTALDPAGLTIGEAERLIFVEAHQAPLVTIDSAFSGFSGGPLDVEFTTTVVETSAPIARVEFYDNGMLIGTDTEEPFGDIVLDFQSRYGTSSPSIFPSDDFPVEGPPWEFPILGGVHNFTAVAYDIHGVGASSPVFQVTGSEPNARPTLVIDSIVEKFGAGGSPSIEMKSLTELVLDAGDEFFIQYTVNDDDGIGDLLLAEAYRLGDFSEGSFDDEAPFTDLLIDTTGWNEGRHFLRVYAQDSDLADSYPTFISVHVRGPIGSGYGQLLADNIVDPTSVTVSNASFLGIEASADQFSGGIDSGLEIDEGVVMTTGSAALWDFGNETDGTDEALDVLFDPNTSEIGDLELETRISGNSSFDAAILTFDIVPTQAQLELEFQFGSEEYPEYVGSRNDAFLIGVGTTIASVLLPNCSDVIAVNSVNGGTQGIPPIPALNQHLFLVNPTDIVTQNNGARVEYDGMVVKLRSHVLLTPGTSYRFKIAIGDVDDDQFDSAVFLKGQSIRSISP